jgi:hypothetical protein
MPKRRADQQKTPDGTAVDWRQRFLAELRESPDVSAAARAAGVDRSYVYALRKSDSGFRAAWDDAIESGVDAIEGVAHAMAKAKDPKMVQFYLKCRRPEIYGDRKEVTHQGQVGLGLPEVVDLFVKMGHDRQAVINAMREAATLSDEAAVALDEMEAGQGDDAEGRTLAGSVS